MSAIAPLRARCCIAGGGPAGVVLGFLLARAGVDVVVLEKHADFFRDFRGDTIHPSTLQVMDELGLLDALLRIPHSQVRELTARVGGTTLRIADFSHVPGRCKYVAIMPQWDFLNFLAEQARRYPSFRLEMETEATDLVYDGERVAGVRATTPGGAIVVRAELVVAADGRHSTLRERAGLRVINVGAPIDVLWMRLSRRPDDPGQTLGNVDSGGFLVAIDRNDYYQCAFVIRKGALDELRARGIEAFRAQIAALAPYLSDRVAELKGWDDVKLLTVAVDRLERWYRPGLLCIGDAAHAMSPVGGVGINLAIQDAVAAANILALPLREGAPSTDLLGIQRRRELPTRLTQGLQVFIQNRVLGPVLRTSKPLTVPVPVRWMIGFAPVRRLLARIVGVGFRPEHVRSPELPPPQA